MLKKSEPRVRRRRLGAVAVCVLVSATSYGAWAFRPADTAAVAALASGQAPVAPVAPDARNAPVAPVAPVDREAVVQKESRALAPPRYPVDAVASKTSGKVVMRVLVGADGSVKNVVVEESVPEGVFDAVSVEAARNWLFNPAIKDGQPVEGWLRIPVEFEIDDPEPDTQEVAATRLKFDSDERQVAEITCDEIRANTESQSIECVMQTAAAD